MTTKIAIMQPTFLPWIGFFALMDYVDVFIFLDDVQFAKRSWQQRNKLLTPAGEKWVTVPVLTKGKRNQIIADVEIQHDTDFSQKTLTSIQHNYNNAPYFKDCFEDIRAILMKNHTSLLKLNLELITLLAKLLDIKTNCVLASDFDVTAHREERLLELCLMAKGDHYVSPPGSKVYLDESDCFEKANIRLTYFDYEHPQYQQQFEPFTPYMSVLDLLFNMGQESRTVMLSGMRS